MRTIALLTPFMLWLMLLASCSTPPRPPTVDEARKRPVNAAMAVELQVCRTNLQNTRLMASESGRRAEAASATLTALVARQQAMAELQQARDSADRSNSVFTVRFDFRATRVDIAPEAAKQLIDEARLAPLVLLRGRTDGAVDSLAESAVARERASAVRDFLVGAGVDPARIRATYQPIGDQVAENTTAGGRSLNRRVEIEIYRVLPVAKELGRSTR